MRNEDPVDSCQMGTKCPIARSKNRTKRILFGLQELRLLLAAQLEAEGSHEAATYMSAAAACVSGRRSGAAIDEAALQAGRPCLSSPAWRPFIDRSTVHTVPSRRCARTSAAPVTSAQTCSVTAHGV
jgi:hypothetical protein